MKAVEMKTSSAKATRKFFLQIRVTEEERELAQAVAEKLGEETIARYVRRRVARDAARLGIAA